MPPWPPQPLPSCSLLDYARAPTEDDSAPKAIALATLAVALIDRAPRPVFREGWPAVAQYWPWIPNA